MAPAKDLSFLVTLLPLTLAIFVIALGVIILNQHFRRNLYKQMLTQEELKSRHQAELLSASIQVQEEERKRITNDLHDELGAMLSMARMHAIQLERQFPSENENSGLAHLRELIESSLASTRRICYELMPPQIEQFGLITALESLVEQINFSKINAICFRYPKDFPRLPWTIELGIYRIVAELINNTLKHAEANQIHIELQLNNKDLHFTYADNGRGLTANSNSKGFGLKSIDARVSSLNGSFVILEEQKGFNVIITLPMF
jgi:signal transduction histidine kinase